MFTSDAWRHKDSTRRCSGEVKYSEELEERTVSVLSWQHNGLQTNVTCGAANMKMDRGQHTKGFMSSKCVDLPQGTSCAKVLAPPDSNHPGPELMLDTTATRLHNMGGACTFKFDSFKMSK